MSNTRHVRKPNEITHLVLVLDGSPSMDPYEEDCNKIATNLIAHYAANKVAGEEIRVTVYSFWEVVQLLHPMYDMDVLRAVGEFKDLYHTGGRATALMDATMLALEDLMMTPQKYGNHDFLVYVLTDGMNNAGTTRPSTLKSKLQGLPDNWGVQVLMPGEKYRRYALEYGFSDYMIDVWDATSKKGFEDVSKRIVEATDNYLTTRRTTGVRTLKGKSLFTLNTVTMKDIQDKLEAVSPREYMLLPVSADTRIDDFVVGKLGIPYKIGKGFYQLMKKETIQPQKEIAILANGRLFKGQAARQMLGLPDQHVEVHPDNYANYTIFVQSTAINRKLIKGTNLLYMN